MADENELQDAIVELTGPNGQVYKFHYGAIIPYEGQDYVVLIELDKDEGGQEQLLITRLEKQEGGMLSFTVEADPDIVQNVFNLFVKLQMDEAVIGSEECGCGCGHDHAHHCGCGCEGDACDCDDDCDCDDEDDCDCDDDCEHEHHCGCGCEDGEHEHHCGCGCEDEA